MSPFVRVGCVWASKSDLELQRMVLESFWRKKKLKTRMNWLFNMVGSFHFSHLCEGWSEGALEGGV